MTGARGKAVEDRDAWRMLASELGFEFKEGIRAMLESERLWSLQNESQAKVILADHDIQAQLRALFETSRGVKVTDHGIRWTQKGNVIDKTSALGIMDRIVSAMEKF